MTHGFHARALIGPTYKKMQKKWHHGHWNSTSLRVSSSHAIMRLPDLPLIVKLEIKLLHVRSKCANLDTPARMSATCRVGGAWHLTSVEVSGAFQVILSRQIILLELLKSPVSELAIAEPHKGFPPFVNWQNLRTTGCQIFTKNYTEARILSQILSLFHLWMSRLTLSSKLIITLRLYYQRIHQYCLNVLKRHHSVFPLVQRTLVFIIHNSCICTIRYVLWYRSMFST